MKLHRLVALSCLFLACSSSAPTTYGQMAPGSPPPVRTLPPAWDSPATRDAPHTTGMPGTIGEPRNYPRGENKRVLPPTKEPGLWSGNPVHASAANPDPVLFGLVLDHPSATPAPGLAGLCAQQMQKLADQYGWTAFASSLPERERRCFAAKLAVRCAEEYLRQNQDWQARSVLPDASQEPLLKQLLSAAEAQRKKECAGEKSFAFRGSINDYADVAGPLFGKILSAISRGAP